MNDSSEPLAKVRRLSAREHQVLALKCAGLTHAEIAGRLVIALPTVKTHIARIYEKLELDGLTSARRHFELTRYAETLGAGWRSFGAAIPSGGQVLPLDAGPDPEPELVLDPAEERMLVPVLEDEILLLEERTRALQVLPAEPVSFAPESRAPARRRLVAPLILLACSLVGGLLGAGLMWALIRPVMARPAAAAGAGSVAAVPAPPAATAGSAVLATPVAAPTAAPSPAAPLCGERQRVKVDTPPFVRTQGLTAYAPENTGGAVLSQWARAVAIDQRGVWSGFFATGQGGRGGVTQFNRVGWADCNLPGAGAGLNVNALAVDAAGRLWVGSEKGGVSVWAGDRWRTYTVEDGLPSNEIFGLTVDTQGIVWAATWEGVAKFDGARWTAPYRVDTHMIHSNHVHALAFDDAGNIWVGHIDRGVSQYRQADGRWVHHEAGPGSIGGDKVRSIVVRPASGPAPESVWFATSDGGVSKFEGGRWTVYRAADGLPSNSANALAVDKYGRVWAATTGGVAYFDGRQWATYDTLPTLSIAFGPACTGCPYGDEHVWTGTEQTGLTVSRLPYPEQALDVVSVKFYDDGGNELRQPLVVAPGQAFRPEIVVQPRQPYQLSEKRGDMLVHVDEDPALRFGAYEHMAVKGMVEPGQPFVFTDYENLFVAPRLAAGERERVFTSRWRVWSHSRYADPPVKVTFTVRAP